MTGETLDLGIETPQAEEPDTPLHLGTQVLFRRTLHRTTRYDSTKRHHVKRWEPHRVPYGLGSAAKPIDGALGGIIVGRRTLANGHAIWGTYEDPTEWVREESVDAYLVAWHLRRRHVLVLPEDLEPIP